MNEENTTEQPQNIQQKTDTSKRSASYPVLTVLEAYSFALKIYSKFSTAEVTRKEMASALSVNDLSIARNIAAAAAYAFFEKNIQKGEKDYKYKVTDLFNDVFRYENEKQKKISLITAFGKPKLFNDLINKFDGSVIPEELNNTLIKHHSITEAASKDVADLFIRSGKEVGVINENRVLNYRVTLGAISKTQYAEIIEENNTEGQGTVPENTNGSIIKIEQVNFTGQAEVKVPIHLTKNKMAYLAYPNDINNKDIKLLEHAISGILLRLDLEKDEIKDE